MKPKENRLPIVKSDKYEEEFKLLGIYSFFEVEDDKIIDWKEYFQLKENVQSYSPKEQIKL